MPGLTLSPPPQDRWYVRQVNVLRFLVPALLTAFVVAYESTEHGFQWGVWDLQMVSEIVYFGVLNPLLVFIAFSYVHVLLRSLSAANQRAEHMNATLEKTVAERTADLRLRNQELAAANAELQKLDQLKSDFVAMVSHGLREPLTNLGGALEIALQEASQKASPDLHQILSIMAEENSRLTRFSKMVLDISYIDAGKLCLRPGPVAVIPLLTWAVAVALPDCTRQVRWSACQSLSPVYADENYLAEILLILLDNVDKYTPPDAPLDITVAVDAQDATRLNILLTDYGPGIAPEFQARVFERFFRIESPVYASTSGWGLGLYFARILTAMQGGSLKLISPVHADPQAPGTQFIVTLPLVTEDSDDG